MKKSFSLLIIYDLLLSKSPFQLNTLVEMLHCSRRTCLRYLKDIRSYFAKCCPNRRIVYLPKKHSFYLEETKPEKKK
ncbi:MAG: HTH domain-containing protein [Bacilli bacterium]|jgi:predicted DNA-binding transcriptional regulator YafY|nr:HTH domain-containing protein [Bacilli bacterium]